jgi:chemotaxis protein histidine kinase CheA
MNEQLSDYSSAYRIIGDEFVPISDDEQFKEIERALEVPLKPVKEHLKRALHFLKGPSLTAALDSIRESIHAVESMCKILTKEENDSLGQALKKLKGKMSIPKDLEE